MRMLALLGSVVAGVTIGALSATAFVDEQAVHQKGRQFSVAIATVRKGNSLTFLNDDNVPHNVASISKGNEFDLGSQPPGTATDVKFTDVGEVQVICAIHPRMKMTVHVTN